jgi:thiol:disulfide interchange protein DsbD
MTDRENEDIQKLRKKYGIFGPPSFIFFDRFGDELKEEQFYGYQGPADFLNTIEMIAEE